MLRFFMRGGVENLKVVNRIFQYQKNQAKV